jgi:hypothetical protein
MRRIVTIVAFAPKTMRPSDKGGIWQRIEAPRRLEKLKRDLANNPLLRSTRLIPVRNGGVISLHGGMAYVRYRDGDYEIVVATLSHPRGGDYLRPIRLAGSDSINVTDPAAIALILDHSFGGFSWLQTNVQEDGVDYELILQSVPGWFEPQELGTTLEMLHMSAD